MLQLRQLQMYNKHCYSHNQKGVIQLGATALSLAFLVGLEQISLKHVQQS